MDEKTLVQGRILFEFRGQPIARFLAQPFCMDAQATMPKKTTRKRFELTIAQAKDHIVSETFCAQVITQPLQLALQVCLVLRRTCGG